MSHSKESILNKKFACKICPDHFDEFKLLKLHEQNIHGMRVYHCKDCDRYYTEGTNYYRHVRNAHRGKILEKTTDLPNKRRKVGGVVSNDTTSSTGPTDKKYICNICNRIFTRIDNLKRHMTHGVCKNPRKLQMFKLNENAVPVVEKKQNTTKETEIRMPENQSTESEGEISLEARYERVSLDRQWRSPTLHLTYVHFTYKPLNLYYTRQL